jgi:hypothetical protein
VVVHRRPEYDELVARHSTRQHADWFLRARGRRLDEVADRATVLDKALQVVTAAIPASWRRAEVEREDLARFVFGPEDVIVVVGQDGLVANVAKYLDGQPVIGIDPEPGRNAGVLVPHTAAHAGFLMELVAGDPTSLPALTMVEAVTDDGRCCGRSTRSTSATPRTSRPAT